jgi:16S rRNA (guanine966-N2)-methyltransferase
VPYAIVFLDPPYAADLWSSVSQRLEEGGFLADGALIYVESPRGSIPTLPSGWRLHRELEAGDVRAALYRRVAPVG